jgi:RNA polymerase sigma factor (sigma-70 family)
VRRRPETPGPAADTPKLGPADWQGVREEIRRIARKRLRGLAAEELEDEVSEAWVKVFLACAKRQPDNLEAFLYTITVRHCASVIRRKQRWDQLVSVYGEGLELLPDPRDRSLGDPVERLERAVLAFFREFHTGCHDLAVAYFDEVRMTEVAARSRVKRNTVIQRWVRCRELLRRAAEQDPGFLFRWARRGPK